MKEINYTLFQDHLTKFGYDTREIGQFETFIEAIKAKDRLEKIMGDNCCIIKSDGKNHEIVDDDVKPPKNYLNLNCTSIKLQLNE